MNADLWGFTCPAQKWKVWRMHVKCDVAREWWANRNTIVLCWAGSLGSSTRMERSHATRNCKVWQWGVNGWQVLPAHLILKKDQYKGCATKQVRLTMFNTLSRKVTMYDTAECSSMFDFFFFLASHPLWAHGDRLTNFKTTVNIGWGNLFKKFWHNPLKGL